MSSPRLATLATLVTLAALALLACDGDAPLPEDAGTDAGEPDGGPSEECVGPRDGGPLLLGDAGPAAPAPALDCGEPTFAAGTPLRRRPYLQSVTRTSARIAWTSTGGARAVVRYAADPAGAWTEVEARTEVFDVARTTDTEDYVAYDATLEGLGESAAYCYELVEDGVVLASGLRLDTAWQGADRPLTILAFGDSGTGSDEQLALRDGMMEQGHDVFLHLGDMAYGSGTFPEFEAHFFGVYRDLMHRVPVFPTMGNHEFATASGQPYLDVYYLPEQTWREQDRERYYSFDWGNVHFVSLDSNDAPLTVIALDTMGRVDDDMIDWLRDDLARSDADWKIAFFHHPPFSSSARSANRLVRNVILPVLEEGGVDLVLVGHDHHYERTVPITEQCTGAGDPGAITYVVAGGGGASLRDTTTSWFTAAIEDSVHSYVRLTIHGCNAHGEALDAAGTVIDAWDLEGCD